MRNQIRQKPKGTSTIPVIILIIFIIAGLMIINFSTIDKILISGINKEMVLESQYFDQAEQEINEELAYTSNNDQ
jgi:hypothetical protein